MFVFSETTPFNIIICMILHSLSEQRLLSSEACWSSRSVWAMLSDIGFAMDLRMSLVQPAAQSRDSCGVRLGYCVHLYFEKPTRMEIAGPLGTRCSNTWLPWWNLLLSLHHFESLLFQATPILSHFTIHLSAWLQLLDNLINIRGCSWASPDNQAEKC